jgi:hypothetical protein
MAFCRLDFVLYKFLNNNSIFYYKGRRWHFAGSISCYTSLRQSLEPEMVGRRLNVFGRVTNSIFNHTTLSNNYYKLKKVFYLPIMKIQLKNENDIFLALNVEKYDFCF